MGKKSKFKQIRRIARQMPEVLVNRIEATKISGADVYAKGVTEIEDKPIDQAGTYIEKKAVRKPLNHNRQMKKLYTKFGPGGVRGYMREVLAYNERMKQEAVK